MTTATNPANYRTVTRNHKNDGACRSGEVELPYDRDPKGLESYEGPDGWWVLGKSSDQTTALLCRFSGQPQMVPAYPAGHEADGWSTFPTQEAARKAAWKFYALTATTK